MDKWHNVATSAVAVIVHLMVENVSFAEYYFHCVSL